LSYTRFTHPASLTEPPRYSSIFSRRFSAGACLAAAFWLAASALSATQQGGPLQTIPAATDLDANAFAEWVDGRELPIKAKDERDKSRSPLWVVATPQGVAGHSGLKFGEAKSPGPRHLRIGFHAPLGVGAVLARGGGRLSVLKPNAPYPGDLADETQWLAAERLANGRVCQTEAGREDYALWTLPQTASTRALRFTHVAEEADKEYAGWLGGVYVMPARLANVAPQAAASARANDKYAAKLINEQADGGWKTWENIAVKDTNAAPVVSPAQSEWVMLTWPAPVKLRGLAALWAGFGAAEAQVFSDTAGPHPREAPESAWRAAGAFAGLRNRYPSSMGADFLDFGREITTRAVRLRMTRAINDDQHPHTKGNARDGRRVWLGELMALSALGAAELKTALLPTPAGSAENPPIAIKFSLPEAGWATLVIEDAQGQRVRNLVADTRFEKGENIVWWDGTDDLGRDLEAPRHGIYHIPAQLVAPGAYQVRGLWRRDINLRYEFPVYTEGNPPWNTADSSGGWLANHSPPAAAQFVPDGGHGQPAVLIGSYVSEGTAGLAWLDLNGRKIKGRNWVGGTWTGAQFLARDAGAKALPGVMAYAAAAWTTAAKPSGKAQEGEIRITAITADGDKAVIKYNFAPPAAPASGPAEENWGKHLGGLAVHEGLVVFSLTQLGQMVLVDAASGQARATVPLANPRGLAFDAQGRLLALSGARLLRSSKPVTLANPEATAKDLAPLVDNLDEPQGLALDDSGRLFVSERGRRHQVRVFGPDGQFQRAIGKPGVPSAGPYDPLRMNNPRGLTVDHQGRLWVAEEDHQPKRVSVWNADGSLWRAFYGPAEYGGGGQLDPADPTRFYYLGMEFRLDWKTGANRLERVFFRKKPDDINLAWRSGLPQTAIYREGRRYFVNCYNSNPTGGGGLAQVWLDQQGLAVPVAALGRAHHWELLKGEAFRARWPAGVDLTKDAYRNPALFVWSDLNGDGQAQPEEVALEKAASGGVTVMQDLSFLVARVEGKAMRYAPRRFTRQGAPVYALTDGQTLFEGAQNPPSSGGDQLLAGPDGWTICTTAPKPFNAHGVGGVRHGVARWSYPSLWPGLHASHEAPVPDRPGMIIGHTRLLGDLVTPRAGEAGPLWFLNGNHGNMYVFTLDGLWVAQLFQDMRVGRPFAMPIARRGMLLNDVTLHDENFWPSVTQTPDGAILLYSGGRLSLVRVEGLETVRRLPTQTITVTAADLQRAAEYFARVEAARQSARGRGVLTVPLRGQPPQVDGKLEDWAGADWVDIDQRGVAAYFNSNSKPFDVTGAVALSGDRLYAAWRTGEKNLLNNTGETPNFLFKTGGCLDLMIGTDPAADPRRNRPVAGDLRLLITKVGGRPRAMLYRAVVPGTKDPVPFTSPVRSITFDRVEEVTAQVQLAESGDGNYEISVPLALLGWKAAAGTTLRGDIGLLRGSGGMTTQRVYWSNKATAITADIPSEAELRPALWGKWEIIQGPAN